MKPETVGRRSSACLRPPSCGTTSKREYPGAVARTPISHSVIAVIGAVLCGVRRVRFGMAMTMVAVAFAALFLLLPPLVSQAAPLQAREGRRVGRRGRGRRG